MRPSFIRLVVVICFLCSFFSAFSQVTLFGDVYIAPKNEIHILSGKLFFESGKIITDRGNNAGGMVEETNAFESQKMEMLALAPQQLPLN